jgi:hypothetical protein
LFPGKMMPSGSCRAVTPPDRSQLCTVPVFEFLRGYHSDSRAAFCHVLRQNTLEVAGFSHRAVCMVRKKEELHAEVSFRFIVFVRRRSSRFTLRDLYLAFCNQFGPIRYRTSLQFIPKKLQFASPETPSDVWLYRVNCRQVRE